MSYERFQQDGAPIYAWTEGVPIEQMAKEQLVRTSQMPFIYHHLAVMPDVHYGKGATVGSVVVTKGAIIPAAVGVDIGCGMVAARTNLTASQLPDNLALVRAYIEEVIPHGKTKGIDKGAWTDPAKWIKKAWNIQLAADYDSLCLRHPGVLHDRALAHLGTLGGGNHFVEVCLDETDAVWVMLHSGSRGPGNRIGTYFIEAAQEEMDKLGLKLEDKDLAYLVEGQQSFIDYWDGVFWAQKFAEVSRQLMLSHAVLAVSNALGIPITMDEEAVNCHHNYAVIEPHYGENVMVTRKGAVRAGLGEMGIIPGSMGTKSYIVMGKGNPESFESCSHGAGRVMSRGAAKRGITLEEFQESVKGVECRKTADLIDEAPAAYKDIDAVMKAQEDLVEIVHTLRAVVCVKG